MKETTMSKAARLASAAWAAVALFTNPAAAKEHHKSADYRVLSEEILTDGPTTDLFLRRDRQGHPYLYLASQRGTLSIFDVSHPEEPRQVNTLVLSSDPSAFEIRLVGEHLAIATAAPHPGESLTILDLADAPAPELLKVLRNVDAYTIDSATNTLYAAQRGKLVILRFAHPITREAEIWEQSYESR